METNPIFSNNITNMYNEQSSGPGTDPCGTPHSIETCDPCWQSARSNYELQFILLIKWKMLIKPLSNDPNAPNSN